MTNVYSENRKFGFVFGGLFILFFQFLIPWNWSLQKIWSWPLMMSLGIVALAVLWPKGLGPLRVLWLKIGQVLGWVNSRVVLSLVFFLVVTPLALIFRLMRKDFMASQWDPGRISYREPSEDDGISRMKELF